MNKNCRIISLLLAAILMLQLAGCAKTPPLADPATQPHQQAVPSDPTGPTAPPDGNPGDVTCKGSYSVSDADFSAAADTVVATLGKSELTNGQLQVYYRMAAAAYTGEDAPNLNKPLDVQLCNPGATAVTWQQFFLEQALSMWRNRQALAQEADTGSFDDAQREFLEQLPQLAGDDAQLAAYARLLNISYIHFSNYCIALQSPAEESEQEPAEESDQVLTEGEPYTVDIRYIRLAPDNAEAQTMMDAFTKAFGDEDDFAMLATQHSLDEGSRRNGGLYTGLRQGWLIDELDAWCFDPARIEGEHVIIEDQDAIHILYFRGASPAGQADRSEAEILTQAETMLKELLDSQDFSVNYSAIRLAPLTCYDVTDAELLYAFAPQEQYPEMPLMIQQDYPYSYYGPGRTVSSHGCGLTCFAMLATYLLDEEQSPADLGPRFARYSAPEGTARSLFNEGPAQMGFGLKSQTLSDEEALAALREGHVVVSLQQRGLFTNGGHYIILAKYQEDGKIKVLDPNKYNYVKSSIREDGFANGFEEKHITAGAKIYWIYEKKTLNDPACDRCGGEGADIFTQSYYCADCRNIVTRLALYEQYCS